MWPALLLLEFCFPLPLLHCARCEAHAQPVPGRFPHVAWLPGAGVLLLAGGLVYDIALRRRRGSARSS